MKKFFTFLAPIAVGVVLCFSACGPNAEQIEKAKQDSIRIADSTAAAQAAEEAAAAQAAADQAAAEQAAAAQAAAEQAAADSIAAAKGKKGK